MNFTLTSTYFAKTMETKWYFDGAEISFEVAQILIKKIEEECANSTNKKS